MNKTVTFVTNQYSCERIIYAARKIADKSGTELVVAQILDNEYELNPQAIDYLFRISKQSRATMRMIFTADKSKSMMDIISQSECKQVVTGMPVNSNSVLYGVWKLFPEKEFFVTDEEGEVSAAPVPARVPEKAVPADFI